MPLSDYDPIFQAAGAEWNVDPVLLKAIAQQESQGNPKAVSKKGARGLMGIMPDTASGIGVTDAVDPTQSIYGAAKYISQLLDKYGTPEKALAAYNAGPGRVDAGAPLPDETRAYVPAVARHYRQFSAAGAPQAEAAAPSDDAAFLARTGAALPSDAAATAPPVNADDAFLARTGAAAAPAPPPQPPQGALPVVSEYGDLAAQPWAQGAQPAPDAITPLASAGGRIGSAAAQAYRDTPPILTPQAQSFVDQSGPIGRYITNPLLHAVGAVPAAVNALGSGAAQAVVEGAGAIGQPRLGRDVNALAQILPFARVGTGLSLTPSGNPLRSAPEGPPTPQFIQEYYGEGRPGNPLANSPPVVTPNPLASAVSAPAFIAPGTPVPPRILETLRSDSIGRPSFIPPSTSTDVMGDTTRLTPPPNSLPTVVPAGALATERAPQSVGAAASREQSPQSAIEMAPAQAQAYRSTAELQKLNEPQPAGTDTTRYVPGVEPTVAHMEQSANVSREQKMLEARIPEPFKDVAREHNENRQIYFNQIAGSPVDIESAIAARKAQLDKDYPAAFANKKPTNAQPVADAIQSILNDPRGMENTQLQKYVAPLLDRLKNADGTLKNDPEQLYGLREDINRMTSRASQADDKNLTHVAAELTDIKQVLDGVIERGAPGYRQYMENYAAASRPIDAMQVLQQIEPKLYDTQGRMQLSRVQSAMRQIVTARAAPGLNPFKSIPDETMAQLWALRDDLRRVASAEELAKARGSDTAQNFMDLVKQGAGHVAGMTSAVVRHTIPGAGLAIDLGAGAVNVLRSKATENALQRRALEMARPDAGKYPPPNPLY